MLACVIYPDNLNNGRTFFFKNTHCNPLHSIHEYVIYKEARLSVHEK